MNYTVHATNAAGQALFLGTADLDAIQWRTFTTAAEALTFAEAQRSAARYDERSERFVRNRVATLRLVHPNGYSETITR